MFWNVAVPKFNLRATAAPTANDDAGDGYEVGSVWIDVTNDVAYVCLSNATGAAVWARCSGAFPNPMTTTGDMIYSSDNSGTPARLGIGTAGYFLKVVSGLPAWAAVSAYDLTTRWEPLANGDPASPALVFSASGDVIMALVSNP